jgi:phosphoenolpyruvate carboxylase
MDTITSYLGYGSYKEWDETTKLDFLTRELQSRRPLIPATMPMSHEV